MSAIRAVILTTLLPMYVFAAESNTAAKALILARSVEGELTSAIERATNAYAFVGGASGVVIKPEGYILTNHHVAEQYKQLTVRVYGTGKYYICDLVGTDPVGDLCLLKARLEPNEKLPFVEFGNMNELSIGQQCLTIGDPFKLADPLEGKPSVSLGTISALHRYQRSSVYQYTDAIQTDAAINQGNSGGPLVTLDGKLIGINGQIVCRFGGTWNTGVGYAIPIDQVARFFPALKEASGNIVYHGRLPEGMTFAQVGEEEAQSALIQNVEPGSEAFSWGLKAGDIIESVDGRPVLNAWRLQGIVQSYLAGTKLKITIIRDKKRYAVDPERAALPPMPLPPTPRDINTLGFSAEPSNQGEGLFINKIEPFSLAERGGLMVEDLILKIDGRRPSLGWHKNLLAKKIGESVQFDIQRKTPTGEMQYTKTINIDRKISGNCSYENDSDLGLNFR